MSDIIGDVRSKGGHETLLRGAVFKGEKELKDEDYLKALCPDTDATFLGHLSNIPKKRGWKANLEGLNEYDLFLSQYVKLKQIASRRLGVAALELFDRYQKVVEAAVLYITSEGTETGDFYGQKAKKGSVQWLVRPIMPASVGISLTDLIYSPGAAGTKGIVPRKATALDLDTDFYTVVADKQILLIFGYFSTLSPRVVTHVQEYVNDGVGERSPCDLYQALSMSDIGLATRAGCLVVNESKKLSVAVSTIVNGDFDIMPFGVDICTADLVTSLF